MLVVTPSFRVANLERTISAVLDSRLPRLERLVIDWSLSDDSVSILCRNDSAISSSVSEPEALQADAVGRRWAGSPGEIVGWVHLDGFPLLRNPPFVTPLFAETGTGVAGDVGDGPAISVVVAVLNGVGTLQRCLDSVFHQTFRDWEVIIVDGGSSDGTVELIERNAPSIHHWESEPDRGICHAWNKALRHARGRWICFLGADDRFRALDVLERMARHLARAEGTYRVVYGSVHVVDASGVVLGTFGRPWDDARRDFRHHMAIPHQATFHHRSLFQRHGVFDERFRICGDYELLLRELASHDAWFVPDLVAVEMHAGGLSDRPASGVTMAKEFHRARRMHDLTRLPEALSFRLFRARSRRFLIKAIGPRATDAVAGAYRIVARRPRYGSRGDRLRP